MQRPALPSFLSGLMSHVGVTLHNWLLMQRRLEGTNLKEMWTESSPAVWPWSFFLLPSNLRSSRLCVRKCCPLIGWTDGVVPVTELGHCRGQRGQLGKFSFILPKLEGLFQSEVTQTLKWKISSLEMEARKLSLGSCWSYWFLVVCFFYYLGWKCSFIQTAAAEHLSRNSILRLTRLYSWNMLADQSDHSEQQLEPVDTQHLEWRINRWMNLNLQ